MNILIPCAVIAIVIIAMIVTLTRLTNVPDQQYFVIEKGGKFDTAWGPGRHLRMPGQTIKNKVSTQDNMLNLPREAMLSKDNVRLVPSVCITYKVTDAEKYTYGVADATQALTLLSLSSIRQLIAERDGKTCKSAPEDLTTELTSQIAAGAEPWGIHVSVARVDNISS